MSKQIISTRQPVHFHDFKARTRRDNAKRQSRAQTPLRHDWRADECRRDTIGVVRWIMWGAIVTALMVVLGVCYICGKVGVGR